MRRVSSGSEEWVPLGYMRRASEFLCTHPSAKIWLDPGMAKTAITLNAFVELQNAGVARKMLVIAPKRVCEITWPKEIAKWSQFNHLVVANMAGKSAKVRKRLLEAQADVWLINPESVPWLCDQFKFQRLPFDTLVIDELTRFKNSRRKRSTKLQPFADHMPRRWGLTGTPIPNGYIDLFGQMKMIDGGAALGLYITQYTDRFFIKNPEGFGFKLRPGAKEQIEEQIEPYVFRASADDYLELPELVIDRREIELSKEELAAYRQMKRDMVMHLDGHTITAVNAGSLYNKLQQMAGGAVYTNTQEREYVVLHNAKIEALLELIDELQGQPLMIAYSFNHERMRIAEAIKKHTGRDVPYLGDGVSGKRALQIVDAWNANELSELQVHPASAGHGLNMQEGGAAHIVYFSEPWDYELYDQLIRRIRRMGTSAKRIILHKLIVKKTIDETKEAALKGKGSTQDALLEALKTEFDDDELYSQPTGDNMAIRRLPGPGAAGGDPKPAATTAAPSVPQGWGTTGFQGTQQAAEPPAQEQAPEPPQAEQSSGRGGKRNRKGGVEIGAASAPQFVDYSISLDAGSLVSVLVGAGMSPAEALATLADTVDFLRGKDE